MNDSEKHLYFAQEEAEPSYASHRLEHGTLGEINKSLSKDIRDTKKEISNIKLKRFERKFNKPVNKVEKFLDRKQTYRNVGKKSPRATLNVKATNYNLLSRTPREKQKFFTHAINEERRQLFFT